MLQSSSAGGLFAERHDWSVPVRCGLRVKLLEELALASRGTLEQAVFDVAHRRYGERRQQWADIPCIARDINDAGLGERQRAALVERFAA